jgi:hypothetical protein
LLSDVEGKRADEVSRKDAKTQRGEEDWDGQNYGAGYLFLSLESFASWRLERSGREITDRKLLSDVEGKRADEVSRKDAKTQRGEEDWDGQNYGAGYLFLAGDTQAERIGNHGVGRTLTEIKPFLIRPLLAALGALLVGLSWVCGSIGRCRRKVGRDFGNSLAGSMGFGRGREPRHPPPPLPRSTGLRSGSTLRLKNENSYQFLAEQPRSRLQRILLRRHRRDSARRIIRIRIRALLLRDDGDATSAPRPSTRTTTSRSRFPAQ